MFGQYLIVGSASPHELAPVVALGAGVALLFAEGVPVRIAGVLLCLAAVLWLTEPGGGMAAAMCCLVVIGLLSAVRREWRLSRRGSQRRLDNQPGERTWLDVGGTWGAGRGKAGGSSEVQPAPGIAQAKPPDTTN